MRVCSAATFRRCGRLARRSANRLSALPNISPHRWHAERFVLHTLDIPLLQPPSTAELLQYLNEPLPHDTTWQSHVAELIVDSTSYQTDFVRGVNAKFLKYTDCTKTTAVVAGDGDPGFLKDVPGGWFGSGSWSACSSWVRARRSSSRSSAVALHASTPTRCRATTSDPGLGEALPVH